MSAPNPIPSTELARSVVKALGGTCKTADFFDVRPGSVSEWLKKGLPKARLRHLQDIRPDLVPKVEAAERDQSTPKAA